MTNNEKRIVSHVRSDGIGRDVLHRIRNPEVIQIGLDVMLKIQVLGAAGIYQHQRIRPDCSCADCQNSHLTRRRSKTIRDHHPVIPRVIG